MGFPLRGQHGTRGKRAICLCNEAQRSGSPKAVMRCCLRETDTSSVGLRRHLLLKEKAFLNDLSF